jgi:hypothetical protein
MMKHVGLIALFVAGAVSGWVAKAGFMGHSEALSLELKAEGGGLRQGSPEGAVPTIGKKLSQQEEVDEVLQNLHVDDFEGEDGYDFSDMSEPELRELISDNPHSKKLLGKVMAHLFSEDIHAGFRFIENTGDQEMKRRLVLHGIASAASIDPNASFDWVSGNTTGDTYDQSIEIVISAMAIKDPKEAATYLESLPYGRAFEMSMMRLTKHWTKKDPMEVITWLDTQVRGAEQQSALKTAYLAIARRFPDDAMSLANSMPIDSHDRSRLMHSIAATMGRKDPYAAMHWAEGLDDPKYMMTVERAWIDNDPWAALEYYSENPERLKTGSANSLARTLSERDPQSAADWVSSLEGSPSYRKAVDALITNWVDHDPMRASMWVGGLEKGEMRDAAARNLAYRIRLNDPSSAFAWAASIDNVKSRQATVGLIVEDWYRRDSKAAYDAVLTGSLPKEEAYQILLQLDNRRGRQKK